MDKKKVVEHIEAHLADELANLVAAAKAAHAAATDEQSKPENQYDTRALEASYLAGAQAQRAAEIQQQLIMYKYMPLRQYGAEDVACPAALVEIEMTATKARSYVFIAPKGGGLIMRLDGSPIQVITPNSPMGEALMGRRAGDRIEVEIRDSTREYQIISIS